MKKMPIIFCLLIFGISFALGLHNAGAYAPSHGFDGVGHVFYIEYVAKNWKMPAPNLNWETHQSPLYYWIGAILMKVSGTWKTAQYMNTFIFWGIIVALSFGLYKVYGRWKPVIFGALSLVALPMMNIFPPMVTNELFNAFWMVLIVTWLIYLVEAKTEKEIIKYLILIGASLIAGFWTKISIIMILPTIFVSLLVVFFQKQKFRRTSIVVVVITTIIILISIAPIFNRSGTAQGPSNLSRVVTEKPLTISVRPDFYYRFDWIADIDMYNAHYYSLWGGAWNSFWTDGQNAVTPFVTFHKKSFILWSMGFVLLPICLYGLWRLRKHNKNVAYLMYVLGLSMLGTYVFYNWGDNRHYSAARLTYEMGIIVPYAFGIAQMGVENGNKKIFKYQNIKIPNSKYLIPPNLSSMTLILLLIQFATMVSFFWILPWWHVTK